MSRYSTALALRLFLDGSSSAAIDVSLEMVKKGTREKVTPAFHLTLQFRLNVPSPYTVYPYTFVSTSSSSSSLCKPPVSPTKVSSFT
jgi:hypothetical protein